MFAGEIVMEDISIRFMRNIDNTVTYTVTEYNPKTGIDSEMFTVHADTFFKALAIAVHNDGTPDYRADYLAAESIMGEIRWIP